MSSPKKPKSQFPPSGPRDLSRSELERIRQDILALKTAIRMQSALLDDLERTLDLQVDVTFP